MVLRSRMKGAIIMVDNADVDVTISGKEEEEDEVPIKKIDC